MQRLLLVAAVFGSIRYLFHLNLKLRYLFSSLENFVWDISYLLFCNKKFSIASVFSGLILKIYHRSEE